MAHLLRRLLSVAAFLVMCAPLEAGPAHEHYHSIFQPNGSTFVGSRFGDEYWNAVKTPAGYTLVQDSNNYWCYARKNASGEVVPTSVVYSAGAAAPPGVSLNLWPDVDVLASLRQATKGPSTHAGQAGPVGQRQSGQAGPPATGLPLTGARDMLCIIVEFSNRSLIGTYTSGYEAEWHTIMFGSSASVADYYDTASAGQFQLQPANESSGVTDNGVVKVTVPSAHPNTTSTGSGVWTPVVKQALTAADQYVDFTAYDTNGDGYVGTTELLVVYVFAGYDSTLADPGDAPQVWGHHNYNFGAAHTVESGAITVLGNFGGADQGDPRTMGYTVMGEWTDWYGGQTVSMGLMCHEIGHEFGLPDLYWGGSGTTIGPYCLMASGAHRRVQGQTPPQKMGDSPSMLCPWSRAQLGWDQPVMASNGSGTYTLSNSENATVGQRSIKVPVPGQATKYILIENRSAQTGDYDNNLPPNTLFGSGPGTSPSRGLLIYVVDTAGNNVSSTPWLVDVIEGETTQDLESNGGADVEDFWNSATSVSLPASLGVSISGVSAAGSTMTFSLSNVPNRDEAQVRRSGTTKWLGDNFVDNLGYFAGTATYELRNTGNTTLTSLAVSAANSSGVVASASAPAVTTLAPGAATTFSVTVQPSAASYDFELSFVGQTVAVYGLNPPNPIPALQVSDSTGIIGNGGTVTAQPSGVSSPSNLTFTLANVGAAQLDISSIVVGSVSSNCSASLVGSTSRSIAPSTNDALTINYTVNTAGNFDFDVTVVSNDPAVPTFLIHVSGSLQPSIEVRSGSAVIPQSGTFSLSKPASAGAIGRVSLTIENKGAATLSISSIVVSPQSNSTATLVGATTRTVPAAATTLVEIDFTFQADGPFSFLLTIQSNDPANPTYSATGSWSPAPAIKGGGVGSGGGGCAGGDTGGTPFVLLLLFMLSVGLWRISRGSGKWAL